MIQLGISFCGSSRCQCAKEFVCGNIGSVRRFQKTRCKNVIERSDLPGHLIVTCFSNVYVALYYHSTNRNDLGSYVDSCGVTGPVTGFVFGHSRFDCHQFPPVGNSGGHFRVCIRNDRSIANTEDHPLPVETYSYVKSCQTVIYLHTFTGTSCPYYH